jgi:hypothetical protein
MTVKSAAVRDEVEVQNQNFRGSRTGFLGNTQKIKKPQRMYVFLFFWN